MDVKKITSFVAGGVAGGAITLLLSPKSGREFRNSIIFRLREFQERGSEEYFEVRERMAESGPLFSSDRGEGGERLSSRASELRERILSTRNRLEGDTRE